jgi:hypothetical protein
MRSSCTERGIYAASPSEAGRAAEFHALTRRGLKRAEARAPSMLSLHGARQNRRLVPSRLGMAGEMRGQANGGAGECRDGGNRDLTQAKRVKSRITAIRGVLTSNGGLLVLSMLLGQAVGLGLLWSQSRKGIELTRRTGRRLR